MTEVEAVMIRDSRAGKPDATVKTRRIRNLLDLKNKQKNAFTCSSSKRVRKTDFYFLFFHASLLKYFF